MAKNMNFNTEHKDKAKNDIFEDCFQKVKNIAFHRVTNERERRINFNQKMKTGRKTTLSRQVNLKFQNK